MAHGVVELTFADGLKGVVDVLDRMTGPVFARARTPEGFGRVRVDAETGTVVWPGGADLAPDAFDVGVRMVTWPEQSCGLCAVRTRTGNEIPPSADPGTQLVEIDRDPTGIFWG